MPLPGEGLPADPFSATQAKNVELLEGPGASTPQVPQAGGWPAGLGGPQAAPVQDLGGLPDYLSQASAFVPAPSEDPNSLHLSVAPPALTPPEEIGLLPGEIDLAAAPKCPMCGATLKPTNHGMQCPTGKHEKGPDGTWKDLSKKDGDGLKASQAIIFRPGEELHLSDKMPGDDLFWKVVCKTGTLALSPGPGQVDVEKPLELTPSMFESLKLGFDEQAFPHVTVPETHANGVLENTGYARRLEVFDHDDPRLPEPILLAHAADPPGTKLLLAGIEFTQPDVRDRAANGSIPDTSVGVKFNYRNKRTGKTYPAALEHISLTPIPWVDGLSAFQTGAMLSQTPFDAEEGMVPFDGVFIDLSAQDGATAEDASLAPSSEAGQLPDELPAADTGDQATMPTVEELLAAQTAATEAATARIADLEARLALSAQTTQTNATALHLSQVDQKIAAWQTAKVAPAVLKRAKALLLADGPSEDGGNELQLSAQVEGTGGAVEEKTFGSATEIVEFLLSAMPTSGAASMVADVQDSLALAQAERQAETDGKGQVEEWERENHPERFADDGKGARLTEQTPATA